MCFPMHDIADRIKHTSELCISIHKVIWNHKNDLSQHYNFEGRNLTNHASHYYSNVCHIGLNLSLLQENPDLWKWLTGQEQPPEAVTVNPVRDDLKYKSFALVFLLFPSILIWSFGCLGLLCSATEGFEKPQQPFLSRDPSNPWPAMGERVGWYQKRSR